MKDKSERHAEICAALNDIYRNKNLMYGDSFGATYRALGLVSCLTRIVDKVNRLQQLARGVAAPPDESIKDTLLDLANYAIMTLMEIEEESPRSLYQPPEAWTPKGLR